jgi:hypothetical protein
MMLGRYLALSLVSLSFLALAGCKSAGAKPDEPAPASSAAPKAGGGDDDADKLAKKQFDLECGKLELNIKRLGIEAEERNGKQDLADAERDLRNAREALEVFQGHEKGMKLDDGQLDLEESEQMRKQRQQELDELMAMYKQEELATLTKELVISRETKSLEFAKRRFEMQKKTTEHQKTVELPKKERELTEAVQKAERKLEEARRKADKSKLENQLEIMKAEHGIAELEKEIAKLQKAPKKEGAS